LSIATLRCEVRVRISAFCLFLSGLILQAFLSEDQTLILLYRYSVMLLILSLDKTIDCNIAVGTMVREAKPWWRHYFQPEWQLTTSHTQSQRTAT